MHTHNHAVVWVDHCMAKIFSLGLTEVNSVTIHAHLPTTQLHHKANEVGPGKVHDDPTFFRRIAETLRNSKAVLLLGPGIEKTALMTHLASGGQSQSFDSLQAESSDHPTDPKIIARGRRHFQLGLPAR
jgi:uncharacterized ferredoxin-like protein